MFHDIVTDSWYPGYPLLYSDLIYSMDDFQQWRSDFWSLIQNFKD